MSILETIDPTADIPDDDLFKIPEITGAYLLQTDEELQAKARGSFPYFQRLVLMNNTYLELLQDPANPDRQRAWLETNQIVDDYESLRAEGLVA